jgi:hypothetical protein
MKEQLRPVGGHILDIDSLELSPQVLTLARNVHMRKGFPSRIRGRRSAYRAALPNEPFHLLNFTLMNTNWWLLFGASTIFAADDIQEFNVSIAAQQTIANPYEWSSTLLNGIPCYTNGKDLPQYWNGDSLTDSVVLPGWPASTTCKFIVAFRFHLFALNITDPTGTYDNLIKWSDATEPGAVPASWTPAPDNEAGSAFLADTSGRAIAGAPLGTQLMIYKPGSFYAIEYAGQQPDNIFIVRPVVRATGLLGPHALKTIGTRQAVVGNEDVVLTDGLNVHSIADNRVKRSLSNSIDTTNSQNVFTIYDDNARELWVCVPETGNQFANIAHIWDERRDNWVTRDLVATKYGTVGYATDVVPITTWNADSGTWDSDTSAWDEGLAVQRVVTVTAGDGTSRMFVEDLPETTLIDARLQRNDLIFGDSEQIKVTNRVHIEGSGSGLAGLHFRLGSRDSTEDGIAWGAYVLREDDGQAYEVAGKFISIEIYNNDSTAEWTVTRITIEAEYDGTF